MTFETPEKLMNHEVEMQMIDRLLTKLEKDEDVSVSEVYNDLTEIGNPELREAVLEGIGDDQLDPINKDKVLQRLRHRKRKLENLDSNDSTQVA